MSTFSWNVDIPNGTPRSSQQHEHEQRSSSFQRFPRFALRQPNLGPFLIADATTSAGESLWTDDEEMCQVYYTMARATRCRDILAKISGMPVEVVILETGSVRP